MSRPGRPRKPDAVRRDPTRRHDITRRIGPTPERARIALAAVGHLAPTFAFGAAGISLRGPLAAWIAQERRSAANGERLDDDAVLELWWSQRPRQGDIYPLDRYGRFLAPGQQGAAWRYARAAWQVLGLPWVPVEATYRIVGVADAPKSKASPEEIEAALAAAQADLTAAEREVRRAAGPDGLGWIARLAVYLEDPWPGWSLSEARRTRGWRMVDVGTDALARLWKIG